MPSGMLTCKHSQQPYKIPRPISLYRSKGLDTGSSTSEPLHNASANEWMLSRLCQSSRRDLRRSSDFSFLT